MIDCFYLRFERAGIDWEFLIAGGPARRCGPATATPCEGRPNGKGTDMTELVLAPLGGGVLIGLAAAGLYFGAGRMAGISGILGDAFRLDPAVAGWRWAFLAGLLAGGALLLALLPGALPARIEGSPGLLVLAGLLVGVGSRMGGGCTSGHGVCGISHRSGRSLVATLTFMTTGAVTVFVVQHLLGGGL
jgi:uncharacterized membrane protein YedE/YeeE